MLDLYFIGCEIVFWWCVGCWCIVVVGLCDLVGECFVLCLVVVVVEFD